MRRTSAARLANVSSMTCPSYLLADEPSGDRTDNA